MPFPGGIEEKASYAAGVLANHIRALNRMVEAKADGIISRVDAIKYIRDSTYCSLYTAKSIVDKIEYLETMAQLSALEKTKVGALESIAESLRILASRV